MPDEKYEGPELDASQVNALLQARATGKVGAILSDVGIPSKTGGRVLAMLRAFAAQGILVERPVADEGTRTIAYFDLAPRANLDFLDLAAIQVLRAFAERARSTDQAIGEINAANHRVGTELTELAQVFGKLQEMLPKIAIGIKCIAAEAGKDRPDDASVERDLRVGMDWIAAQTAALDEILAGMPK